MFNLAVCKPVNPSIQIAPGFGDEDPDLLMIVNRMRAAKEVILEQLDKKVDSMKPSILNLQGVVDFCLCETDVRAIEHENRVQEYRNYKKEIREQFRTLADVIFANGVIRVNRGESIEKVLTSRKALRHRDRMVEAAENTRTMLLHIADVTGLTFNLDNIVAPNIITRF